MARKKRDLIFSCIGENENIPSSDEEKVESELYISHEFVSNSDREENDLDQNIYFRKKLSSSLN